MNVLSAHRMHHHGESGIPSLSLLLATAGLFCALVHFTPLPRSQQQPVPTQIGSNDPHRRSPPHINSSNNKNNGYPGPACSAFPLSLSLVKVSTIEQHTQSDDQAGQIPVSVDTPRSRNVSILAPFHDDGKAEEVCHAC